MYCPIIQRNFGLWYAFTLLIYRGLARQPLERTFWREWIRQHRIPSSGGTGWKREWGVWLQHFLAVTTSPEKSRCKNRYYGGVFWARKRPRRKRDRLRARVLLDIPMNGPAGSDSMRIWNPRMERLRRFYQILLSLVNSPQYNSHVCTANLPIRTYLHGHLRFCGTVCSNHYKYFAFDCTDI